MPATKQSHTPGPWKVIGNAGSEGRFGAKVRIVSTEKHNEFSADTRVCDMTFSTQGQGVAGRPKVAEAEANARLIASAPDLLAIVKDLVSQVSAMRALGQTAKAGNELLERAQSAIRRAEGGGP